MSAGESSSCRSSSTSSAYSGRPVTVRPNTSSSSSPSQPSRVALSTLRSINDAPTRFRTAFGIRRCSRTLPVVEVPRGEQLQQVVEVVVAEVQWRRRQEHERVGPVGQERTEGVAPGAAVAEDVRLVDDDEVETGRELSQAFETTPDAKALDADDAVESSREPVLLELVEHLVESRPVEFGEFVAEALLHLATPLADEHRRADDQHAVGLPAGVELGPDQAGLDRLAETDLVGDEQPHAAASRAAAGSGRNWYGRKIVRDARKE